MNTSLEEIANLLKNNNNFYILTHQYPDGDTLGSAYALSRALKKINKKVKVLNEEPIPEKYSFLQDGVKLKSFLPECIICVDVADVKLLGPSLEAKYAGNVDLCLDHHRMNKKFSKFKYIDASAAATAEIIYNLLKVMNIEIDSHIANSIYTGIATDTGCFKYKNTTANTHRIAANLITFGASVHKINKLMFDSKTKEQFIAERFILDTMEFYFDNKLAIVYVMLNTLKKSGAKDYLIEGIAGIPKQIFGVQIGVTFRQKDIEAFKVSVRTENGIDASLICNHFGGGGHTNAAGCMLYGSLSEVKALFLNYAKKFLV